MGEEKLIKEHKRENVSFFLSFLLVYNQSLVIYVGFFLFRKEENICMKNI